MTDFLEEKRREITNRLAELEPAVDEYGRLQAAATALAALNGSAGRSAGASTVSAPRAARRRPGRPRGSAGRTGTATATAVKPRKQPGRPKGRSGRPKGSGTRTAETLAAVQAQPGITIAELAKKLGIKPNYLYRVLPPLQKEGKVSKRGKGWHPK